MMASGLWCCPGASSPAGRRVQAGTAPALALALALTLVWSVLDGGHKYLPWLHRWVLLDDVTAKPTTVSHQPLDRGPI